MKMKYNLIILLAICLLLSLSVACAEENNKDTLADSEYTFFDLTKVWENDNENNRPDSVTFDIIRDGEVKGTITLTKSNNWQSNDRTVYPEYDNNGDRIVYSFREHDVDGYYLYNTIDNGNMSYTLVNRATPENNTTNNTDTSNDTNVDENNNTSSKPLTNTTTTQSIDKNTDTDSDNNNTTTPVKKEPKNDNKHVAGFNLNNTIIILITGLLCSIGAYILQKRK